MPPFFAPRFLGAQSLSQQILQETEELQHTTRNRVPAGRSTLEHSIENSVANSSDDTHGFQQRRAAYASAIDSMRTHTTTLLAARALINKGHAAMIYARSTKNGAASPPRN
jgi:hypothetical protein